MKKLKIGILLGESLLRLLGLSSFTVLFLLVRGVADGFVEGDVDILFAFFFFCDKKKVDY